MSGMGYEQRARKGCSYGSGKVDRWGYGLDGNDLDGNGLDGNGLDGITARESDDSLTTLSAQFRNPTG